MEVSCLESGSGEEHDLSTVVRDLRDQLARHDKPIAFLFGAGTSCSVRIVGEGGSQRPLIPTVVGLTQECRDEVAAMGDAFGNAWQQIEANCAEASQSVHIESILSRLRMMRGAIGGSDVLAGLGPQAIADLEDCVRRAIAKRVMVDCDSLATDLPHRKFARWIGRVARQRAVEIFTVNYDVLIEHALECERIPMFDGFIGAFRPFFCADSLRYADLAPGQQWTRLWKLHGSVTWKRVESRDGKRVIRGEPDPAGAMIYPSFEKYSESRQQPYVAFLNRLRSFLDQDDALLLVAGFSFGDEHINNTIFDALASNPRTHVYALQFEEPATYRDLEQRALQRPNLVLLGPRTGIIGARRGKWVINDGETSADSVFASISVAEGGGASGVGQSRDRQLKLGDFAHFCGFLESMTMG